MTKKIKNKIYRILDIPWVYNITQALIAPGAQTATISKIQNLILDLPNADFVLDVACGPFSNLYKVGLKPLGLDISLSYAKSHSQHGGISLVGTADKLPLSSQSADGVWCIGLLHHLPNHIASRVIRELVRVCKSRGYIVIIEGVLPHAAFKRPIAYFIRRVDRGEFMRTEKDIKSLLPYRDKWSIDRFSYSYSGLERLICCHLKK